MQHYRFLQQLQCVWGGVACARCQAPVWGRANTRRTLRESEDTAPCSTDAAAARAPGQTSFLARPTRLHRRVVHGAASPCILPKHTGLTTQERASPNPANRLGA